MRLVTARAISHYRIDRTLGQGGMGVVYLGYDLALGREAAIKVVSDAGDLEFRRRLLREADACARLQHPAIATFFEAGETPEGAFIAMEYVRGETLRARLGRGALPVDEALRLASAILEALNHAHAAGILHRDIKPENIMVPPRGVPKLLDFGVARIGAGVSSATVTNLTAGRILGTFGYMAPEQLAGGDVDARADLFAFAAVLYEMITGRAAFPGADAAERIAAVLSREPTLSTGPSMPAPFVRLLARALAKDPAARYGSAAELLGELRAVESGEAATPLPLTLTVVDLRNLSGRSEDDWIGSGIAESLTSDLTRLPGLTIVSREKTLRAVREAAASGAADALDVGRTLGCRWVLSGSFQRLGPSLRITTALTEVGTGTIIAAEKLDGSIDGIFELQDRLSRVVAESLNVHQPARTPVTVPRDVEAFECYARGRRLWQRLEKGSFERAGELYRRVIAIEPAHAQALSGLAALYAMRFTFTTDSQDLERAADYAARAIASDRRLADPHVWLGYVYMRQERMDDALAEERLAWDLDPNAAYAPYFAGCTEAFRARPDAALPFLQSAVRIDPQHGFAWSALGNTHVSLRNFAEARWCLERALALEAQQGPGATAGVGAYLGECHRLAGDLAAARAACLSALEQVEGSDHMYRDSFRGLALGVLGRTAIEQGAFDAARAAFHQLLAHVNGRERTLGGGHMVVQALAGLARAGEGAERLEEARELFASRRRFNFSVLWTCTAQDTEAELTRAAEHS